MSRKDAYGLQIVKDIPLRKSLIVVPIVLCSMFAAVPSYASYVVDSPYTGIERLQFPPLPTVTTTYSPPVSHGSYGSPQAIAAQLVSPSQLGCFDSVINRESGWDVHATNPSSGAYGLPQALPGSKMASEGADWQYNPRTQLRWALKYMNGTYGSPCGAWSHEINYGWY